MYPKRILEDHTTIVCAKFRGLSDWVKIEIPKPFNYTPDIEAYMKQNYPSFERVISHEHKTAYVCISEPDFQHYCTPCDEHGNRIGSKPGRR